MQLCDLINIMNTFKTVLRVVCLVMKIPRQPGPGIDVPDPVATQVVREGIRRVIFDKEFRAVGVVKPLSARRLFGPVGKDGGPLLEEMVALRFLAARFQYPNVELEIEMVSEGEGEELERRRGRVGIIIPDGVGHAGSCVEIVQDKWNVQDGRRGG